VIIVRAEDISRQHYELFYCSFWIDERKSQYRSQTWLYLCSPCFICGNE